ncbi:DUF7878 domain-containing protein [Nocardiopsis coralliicola]
MGVEFTCTGVNCADLRVHTAADYFVHVEGDFRIADGGRTVYAEPAFPVAELAHQLTVWAGSADPPTAPFSFASMSFADDGAVSLTPSPDGLWTVWSAFTPHVHSRATPWPALAHSIAAFTAGIRADAARLGLRQHLLAGGVE